MNAINSKQYLKRLYSIHWEERQNTNSHKSYYYDTTKGNMLYAKVHEDSGAVYHCKYNIVHLENIIIINWFKTVIPIVISHITFFKGITDQGSWTDYFELSVCNLFVLDFPMHDLASLLNMSFTLQWELTQCKIAASSKVDIGLTNSVLIMRKWLCRKISCADHGMITHGFSNDFTCKKKKCNEKHCRSWFNCTFLIELFFVVLLSIISIAKIHFKNLKYLYFIDVVDMYSGSQGIHADIDIFKLRSLVLPNGCNSRFHSFLWLFLLYYLLYVITQ